MTATDRAVELVKVAAEAASDKLAQEIIAYDVSDQLVITEAFVLCSAPNDRQVRAIVDDVATSGATLSSLASALKNQGAKRVEAWVLARAISLKTRPTF